MSADSKCTHRFWHLEDVLFSSISVPKIEALLEFDEPSAYSKKASSGVTPPHHILSRKAAVGGGPGGSKTQATGRGGDDLLPDGVWRELGLPTHHE